MPRMDAGSAIAPAFEQMIRVLFKPFQARKWLTLGFIALLTSGGGGGNFNVPGNYDTGGAGSGFEHWITHYWPILIVGCLLAVVLGFLLMWLTSVLHFVYLDDVVRCSGAIREPFHRLRGLGTSLFLWRLGFGLLIFIAIAVLVAAPVLLVLVLLHDTGTAAKVAAIAWAVLAGISLLLIACIISTFVQDFVSVAMYARGVRIMEGWHIVLPILRANVGQVILYLLLLIAFGFGLATVSIIAALMVAVIVLIPFGAIALVGYLIGLAAHLTLNAPVIAVIVTYGIAVYLIFAYLLTCVLQPGMVFMRSFSLAFLGQADPSLATIPIAVTQPAQATE